MNKLPQPLQEFLMTLTIETRLPAFMLVLHDGRLGDAGGELKLFGLDKLRMGEPAAEQFPLLEGMLPLDSSPVALPYVKMESGLMTDVYFINDPKGVWVFLLDATWEARKRRAIQQRANELSLHLYVAEREQEELTTQKDQLADLVEERSTDLAQANLDLRTQLEERKKAEEALRVSEARFRRVFDSNMLGILFWDLNGVVTEANAAFLNMIGYTPEDVKAGAVRWDSITEPTFKHLDERAIEEMRSGGASRPFLKEFIRKDGTRVPLWFGAALLKGSETKTVCFALDANAAQPSAAEK